MLRNEKEIAYAHFIHVSSCGYGRGLDTKISVFVADSHASVVAEVIITIADYYKGLVTAKGYKFHWPDSLTVESFSSRSLSWAGVRAERMAAHFLSNAISSSSWSAAS